MFLAGVISLDSPLKWYFILSLMCVHITSIIITKPTMKYSVGFLTWFMKTSSMVVLKCCEINILCRKISVTSNKFENKNWSYLLYSTMSWNWVMLKNCRWMILWSVLTATLLRYVVSWIITLCLKICFPFWWNASEEWLWIS